MLPHASFKIFYFNLKILADNRLTMSAFATVPSLALLVEVGKALVKAPGELEANHCTRLNLSDHLDL